MKELISKIDSMIDESDEALIRDTVRLVNIKSVREKPLPQAPFGLGVKAVVNEFKVGIQVTLCRTKFHTQERNPVGSIMRYGCHKQQQLVIKVICL